MQLVHRPTQLSGTTAITMPITDAVAQPQPRRLPRGRNLARAMNSAKLGIPQALFLSERLTPELLQGPGGPERVVRGGI